MRPKTRPAFKTAAMEAAELAQLDARLSRQDAERRQQLDAAIERDLAARTPERIAQDNAELSRLDVIASEDSRLREERLRQRRTVDQFSTIGT